MRQYRYACCSHSGGCFGMALLLAFVAPLGAAPQTKRSSTANSHGKSGLSLSEPASAIQSLIQAKRLDDLRWPDFSDYSQQVENFYRSSNYSRAWIQDSRVTERGKEMIQELSSAEAEGLNSEDYDGPRWADRIAHLEKDHAVQYEARFEIALTVCTMRYISAVRIGRINPKHLKFGFDVEHKKLDLPTYLALLNSSSSDLQDELAKIEPPFPSYAATRRALLRYIELAKQDDGEKLPPSIGTVYRLGYYDHMPGLARRLRQLGDMPQDAVVPDDVFFYGRTVDLSGEAFSATSRPQS